MVNKKNALFITARMKSLGETYTAYRFARNLGSDGWVSHFLAFEFAASFLQSQGLAISMLGDNLEKNHELLTSVVASYRPDLIIASDYYLFTSADVTPFWSTEWFFDFGLPLVIFDHLKFHPEPRSLSLAFFQIVAPHLKSFQFPIDRLPTGVTALVRPCPLHDPTPDADNRIYKFNPFDDESLKAPPPRKLRERLGFSSDEKIILVPVGSWALQMAQELIVQYYLKTYPGLLRHYFRHTPVKIRFVFVSAEFEQHRQYDGPITMDFYSALPFEVIQDLVRIADLILCDNITSSSVSRAVMNGTPAAALINSVKARHGGNELVFEAPFPLSEFAVKQLTEMEKAVPNSVFPYLVFPLGWVEETRPLFEGNPYNLTFERVELFDEESATDKLENLLFNQSLREEYHIRQKAYANQVKQLPNAAAVTEQIMRQNQS